MSINKTSSSLASTSLEKFYQFYAVTCSIKHQNFTCTSQSFMSQNLNLYMKFLIVLMYFVIEVFFLKAEDMSPNLIGTSIILAETAIDQETKNRRPTSNGSLSAVDTTIGKQQITTKQSLEISTNTKPDEYKLEIVWRNVVAFAILHMFALYGIYIMCTEWVFKEYLWGHFIGVFGGFGITAGAHRLWAHRAYKAKWPLRFFLMICQSIAFQNSIHEWVRDHRVHHKFCDTHADPHNSRRGFFFSHMGWLMCKKHPDVKSKGKLIDMSDLEADPIVMFQKRHYMPVMLLSCFILPALVPYFCFGTSIRNCFFVCSIFRYVMSLHFTWLVNSAAHIWGMKPYDKTITPTDNMWVAIAAYGEGWHNYHHVFPWDYKTAELGDYSYNLSTALIDFFAKIGWAYDLKTVSPEIIKKRVLRTGDGSHEHNIDAMKTEELVQELNDKCNHEDLETLIWGWDDEDMTQEEKQEACVLNKED